MESKEEKIIITSNKNTEDYNEEEDTNYEEEKIKKSPEKIEKKPESEQKEEKEKEKKESEQESQIKEKKEEQNEIVDTPNSDEKRREFLTKDQWEEEIELYRAYLLNLSCRKEPEIYRLTSEIHTAGTLTFRIFKKEIKNFFFEAKLSFQESFYLFGYKPLVHFQSLTALYTRVIEFLIQELKFKLKEPIVEKSNKATIKFINNRVMPNKIGLIVFKKVYVKEKKIDDCVKSYLAEIDRKLYDLKIQNRIFFEMEDGPRRNNNFYNYFKEPDEIKREKEIILRNQKELEYRRKREEELEKSKTPLQKLNEILKTSININDKKITLQKEYFNNDTFRMLSKNNFNNLEVLEISCNFITDLKELASPGFKNLKVIYLHTKVKDISFFEKVHFENLEDLSLIGNNFNSVEYIAKAPFVKNLKKLDLYKNGIKSIEGFICGKFEKLILLVLSNNNIKDLDRINKDTFKILADIKLEENEIQDIEGLENFNDYFFENVKKLDLNTNRIKNADSLEKYKFDNLQVLILNNNKIVHIEFLEKLKAKNLLEIYLNHNFIKIFEPLTKANFPDLKVLQITDNPNVTDFDFLNRLPFQKLEKLYCCGYSSLKDIDFLKKKNYENLRYLSLTRNQIMSIDALKDCNFKNLVYLSLEENAIKNINVFSSVRFKDLEELYMDRNKIDSIQVLERVPFVNIKRINFSQNCFVKITVLGNLKFNKIQSIHLQGGNVYIFDEDNRIAKERFKWRYPDCSLYV